MITPVILCGGGGRRLWPLSRPDRPKPLLSLGGPPLLRASADRFTADGFAAPWLVAGTDHADAMMRLVPEASHVIIEPSPRGTAAAVAAAACLAVAQDPEALLLVTPADHVVQDAPVLRAAAGAAGVLARGGSIVTFGIEPTFAATGYGWIAPGEAIAGAYSAHRIKRFAEKPPKELAEQMLREGTWLWNAGLFLFRAQSVLEELQRWAPAVLAAADAALQGAVREGTRYVLEPTQFCASPTPSFDVAVMEKTERAVVVAVACGWSDVGGWGAVRALGDYGSGPVDVRQSPGSFVFSDGPHVAVFGVKDALVVAAGGAVLVASADLVDRCGELPPAIDVVLDRSATCEVSRRRISAGGDLVLPLGSQATVIEGCFGEVSRGGVLGPGIYRTTAGATVVIVTFLALPSR